MKYEHIVILTGAGISAESGLATFRDNNGLWENHRVEDVATPEAFAENPSLVYAFYNARRSQLQSHTVAPNLAHVALAELEQKHGGSFTLITQNVDDLHKRAGSGNVLHMHGELLSARCIHSQETWFTEQAFDHKDRCECCQPGSGIRPDIVWFGEMPKFMDEIEHALSSCDLFLSIGTSGHVYPAAGFVQLARTYGAHTVELNLEPSQVNSDFAERHYGKASELVPHYVKTLLEGT